MWPYVPCAIANLYLAGDAFANGATFAGMLSTVAMLCSFVLLVWDELKRKY